MAVDSFNHDAGGAPALDGTGNDSFNVGATLSIGAGQLAGADQIRRFHLEAEAAARDTVEANKGKRRSKDGDDDSARIEEAKARQLILRGRYYKGL